MGYLVYNFDCPCGHRYEDLVQGTEGRPDPCPKCGGTKAARAITACAIASKMIPVYPGYKRHAAGYAAEERRPAEKKGRQISLHGTKGAKGVA